MNTRIKELEELILKYQNSYYNGEAEIEDSEFDKLWDELKLLDPKNPILQKVGQDNDSTEGFEKASHIMVMGSQEKAANPEEFLEWANKHPYKEYLVEYKLDGASLELQYENGQFVKAVTRGDGSIGDDITQNVLKMSGYSKTLSQNNPQPGLFEERGLTGAVRGEVIMEHTVHKTYFSDKANCRNAANGLMKRKEGNGCEHLKIICYDAYFPEGNPFADEEEKLNWLKKQGFETVPLHICKSYDEVVSYRAEIMEKRPYLPYDIDGLVIKNRTIDIDDVSRNRPDKQIAFKFNLEEAVTVLKSVIWSESGMTYTPIAEFDAVELAGTTVQKASLSNPNAIRALGLKIGSHVVVTKRGEIIPKIEGVVKTPEDATEIEFPTVCTTCGAKLIDEGTRLYCPNHSCSKRIHHQIEKWVDVFEIRDLGENLIKTLFENKRLLKISDIYTLTADELASLERMGEKSALKVINSINNHREVSLAKFIAGFDIENIGETLMEKLTAEENFNSIEKLFNAKAEDIASIDNFGDILAKNLTDGIKENKEEMENLLKQDIIKIKEVVTDGKLSGKSFCFTGELYSMKRNDAEKLVKSLGGTTKSSVSKTLTYLVTNDTSSGSSKNKKAQELNIPVITEKEFLEMVK